MERGIANTLHEHLSCNDLLSSVQRGFVKGKSTCTNLLECMNDWTLILQDKSCVRVAYVDFSKAFDTTCVPRKTFCSFTCIWRSGASVEMDTKILTGRSHQTRIGCWLSEIADLLGGVVQGSGLGPVLFLVFTDGLAKALERFGVVTKFFADDVKVYLRIVKSDDCVILQIAESFGCYQLLG